MFNQIPYMNVGNFLPTSNVVGTGTSILRKINWATLLSNTQKTLNVVNQAVPLYYQVKPVFKNIKAISKIGKEFSKTNNNTKENYNNISSFQNNSTNESNNIKNNVYKNIQDIPTPTFFI